MLLVPWNLTRLSKTNVRSEGSSYILITGKVRTLKLWWFLPFQKQLTGFPFNCLVLFLLQDLAWSLTVKQR